MARYDDLRNYTIKDELINREFFTDKDGEYLSVGDLLDILKQIPADNAVIINIGDAVVNPTIVHTHRHGALALVVPPDETDPDLWYSH